MRNLRKILGGAVAATLLAGASQAATVTVYTDRTSWESAIAGPITTEDFEGVATGTLTGGGVETTLGSLGFSYLGSPDGAEPEIVNGGLVNGSREFNGEVNGDGTPSGDHTFNFLGSSVLAFGADFASTLSGAQLTIAALGETINFSDHLAGNGNGFLGIVADMSFDSILFSVESSGGISEVFSMDDASFAVVSQIPVPAGAVLLLTGMVGFGFGARRRKS